MPSEKKITCGPLRCKCMDKEGMSWWSELLHDVIVHHGEVMKQEADSELCVQMSVRMALTRAAYAITIACVVEKQWPGRGLTEPQVKELLESLPGEILDRMADIRLHEAMMAESGQRTLS